MRIKSPKILPISLALIVSNLSIHKAYADLSYGAKFIVTTLSGCAAGGTGAYFVAQNGGYDSQPKQIVTFIGATTGCITGALFSYAFFNDNSATLQTKISEQQKTIQDLSLQLAQTQGQIQNGSYPGININSLPNPFDKLELKEGTVNSKFDTSSLPHGLNLKNCNKLWQYTLAKDGDDLINERQIAPQIVAVSPNFALVGFTFLYSPNECFSPSIEEGHYAEEFFPGLNNFLKRRVINYNSNHE